MTRPGFSSWLRRIRRGLAALSAAALLLWYAVPWCFPWPEELNSPPLPAAAFLDRDGLPLRRLPGGGRRTGEPLRFAEIPPALLLATQAAEDQRFLSHGGIDARAAVRAVRDSLTAGRQVSGASTITQQLVKIVQPRPRTLWTKIIEIFTARRIEMTWDKEQILAAYLNRLDYGSLATGCSEASWVFFDKPLADCSLAECAFLAGLPQAPGRLSPWRNPAGAQKRQAWVLSRLKHLAWITPEEYTRAAAEPVHPQRTSSAFRAPHFVDYLLASLDPEPGDRIRTTLSTALQEQCERTIRNRLSRLAEHHVRHAAAIVIDNATGGILAMVGSPDYGSRDSGQVNGTTARRSPGSALKPFTFLLAFQNGQSPATIVPDLPVEFITPTGVYRPENYNHRAAGPVRLREALANSLNISAVRTLHQNGGAAALTAALKACGVTSLTRDPDDYGLGLTIGGGEVSLLELTGAYACLARLGTFLPPSGLLTAPPGNGTRVFDPAACWLIADVLSDNDARLRSFGMDSALRLPFPAAVKTGTSTDYRDNWTLGYTPRFTVGVWTGNFDNSPMRGVSGVTGAAPICHDILSWLETRFPSPWFTTPPDIVERDVDPLTGKPVPPALSGRRPVVREKFLRGFVPKPDPAVYDAAGRVRLPLDYAAWLAGPDNWLGTAAAATAPAIDGPLQILSPVPGSVLLLDPDIPGGGRLLPLRASAPAEDVDWSSPTLAIEAHPRGFTARLEPGTHQLTARLRKSGVTATATITVRGL